MESLTDEQRAEVDTLILAKSIIAGMSRIMKTCGVGLADARELFKARYRQLRTSGEQSSRAATKSTGRATPSAFSRR